MYAKRVLLTGMISLMGLLLGCASANPLQQNIQRMMGHPANTLTDGINTFHNPQPFVWGQPDLVIPAADGSKQYCYDNNVNHHVPVWTVPNFAIQDSNTFSCRICFKINNQNIINGVSFSGNACQQEQVYNQF